MNWLSSAIFFAESKVSGNVASFVEMSVPCVAYEIDGKRVTDFPAGVEDLEKAKPVLEKFKGWKTELKNCRSYDALPENARTYIKFIEDYCETPVTIISVGYERNDTFVRENPWSK